MEKPSRKWLERIKGLRPSISRSGQVRRRVPLTAYRIAVAALIAFGVVAAAVTLIAVVESYSNLYAFFSEHGLHGWRAAIAPGAVDSFIIMGELLLFAGLLMAWDSVLAYSLGCGMAVWGFGLSIAGNVAHAQTAPGIDRAVAAIWPVTATAGLAGGLLIIKHVMASHETAQPAAQASVAKAPSPAPSSKGREPHRPVPGSAARTTELAAVPEHVREVALKLVTAGKPLPTERKLAEAEFGGSIRSAQKARKLALAQMNGAGSGDVN